MKNNRKSKIKTNYVFLKNNKVYTKNNIDGGSWYCVNFKWMPIIELKHTMSL